MLHFLGMRATLVALLACIFAHLSNAQVILLSENRSVSASGWAQGEGAGLQSYSFIQTPSASFADFNGSVSGSADSTDVIPPDLGYGNLTLFPHHAKSQSNQTSTISPSAIAVSGSLLADEGGFAFRGGGSSLSLARSVFEVGFRVDAPIAYTLSAAPLLGIPSGQRGRRGQQPVRFLTYLCQPWRDLELLRFSWGKPFRGLLGGFFNQTITY